MARTLVNSHQLAPFSGSTSNQIQVDSLLNSGPGSGAAKDAALNMTSGSIDKVGTIYFSDGTTGTAGSIAGASSGIQLYGNSHVEGTLNVDGTLTFDTSLTIDAVTLTTAELQVLDGVTLGTAAASKAVTLDANADVTGARNITLSGELDAASLDISGDADIDGTLEADAYTVNGVALDEQVSDWAGAMFSGNTETGVTATYQDGDNTIDLAIAAAQTTITSLLATDIKIGEDDQTKIDFETNDEIHFYAANAEQVYVADGIFGPQTDSDVDLGSTGVRWKDAFVDSLTTTANVTVGGDLTVQGTTTTVNTVTMEAANAVVFEGATADANETTLTIVDPTADHTQRLINQSGWVPLLSAVTTTAITSTPAELNLLDGGVAVGSSITIADGDGMVVLDGGVSKTIPMSDVKTYCSSLDIDGFAALGGTGLHQTDDHFIFSDAGTEKKITFSNLQDAVFADVSGDATIAAGGALTLGSGVVEHGMLAEDIISGQAELAHADIADADDMMISDSGTIKKVGVDSLRDHFFGVVSGDATVADGGALTIAAGAVENSMLADDAVGADELASNAVVNASVVDGSIKADKLDIDGSTDIGAGLADADLIIVDDGAGGTNRKAAMSRVKVYTKTDVSTAGAAEASKALIVDANVAINSGLTSVTGSKDLFFKDVKALTNLHSQGGLLVSGSTILGAAGANPTATITARAPFSASYGMTVMGEEGADGVLNLAADEADDAADRWAMTALAASAQFELRHGSGTSPLTVTSAGNVTVLGDLTITGDDLIMGTNTSGYMLVADGTSYNPVAISGDVTMANNGAVTIAAGAVEHGMLAEDIISGQAALGGASVAQADLLMLDDGPGTVKKVTFSNFEDSIFGNISGDATVAAGGALTIAAGAVENSMLADDAVGADELAANAVVEASIVDNAVTLAKMAGLARGKFIYGDASGDPAALAVGSAHQFLQADGTDLAWVSMSGDVTLAAGVATIQANAVEGSMLNNNIVSGLADIGAAIVGTDEMIVSDAGSIKRTDVTRLGDFLAGGSSGIGVASGQLTVDFEIDTVIGSSGHNYASATGVYTLGAVPVTGSEMVFLNGQMLMRGAGLDSGDYTCSYASSGSVELHPDLKLDGDDVLSVYYLGT